MSNLLIVPPIRWLDKRARQMHMKWTSWDKAAYPGLPWWTETLLIWYRGYINNNMRRDTIFRLYYFYRVNTTICIVRVSRGLYLCAETWDWAVCWGQWLVSHDQWAAGGVAHAGLPFRLPSSQWDKGRLHSGQHEAQSRIKLYMRSCNHCKHLTSSNYLLARTVHGGSGYSFCFKTWQLIWVCS